MKVYLDNSATTAMSQEVLQSMIPYYLDKFGNPSSLHSYGREAQKAVDEARESIAKVINARDNEIYFTSGGTESDNWALRGAVLASKNKIKHIITTEIEHHAILRTCKDLEKEGVLVTYLKPGSNGIIRIEDVISAVTKNTILVSVMFANNEIGTIQPIEQIGRYCTEEGILFHTDAVQAMDSQNIDVIKMGIDLLSMSAHKFRGPKGVGVLFIRSGARISRLIFGGEQERGERAGTTPTPLIVGMAKALKIAAQNRTLDNNRILAIRNNFVNRVLSEIPYTTFNGDFLNRLPNNANFSFAFIEGESILMRLDLAGIAVSSGSACASGSLESSHVIRSIGVSEELAHSAIRFSLGTETTEEEMEYVFRMLEKTVDDLRMISPIYDYEKGIGSYV